VVKGGILLEGATETRDASAAESGKHSSCFVIATPNRSKAAPHSSKGDHKNYFTGLCWVEGARWGQIGEIGSERVKVRRGRRGGEGSSPAIVVVAMAHATPIIGYGTARTLCQQPVTASPRPPEAHPPGSAHGRRGSGYMGGTGENWRVKGVTIFGEESRCFSGDHCS